VDVAIYLRDFVDDPRRPLYQQIEDAADVVRRARSLGFMGIYNPQHWVGYPTLWVQPLPLLARLAPEAKGLKLITGVLLLPLHNPVDLAEQIITMDHISNGRFVLGLGLGYRETELEAVGTNRQERASRFEESLDLMKRLWSGEEVTFEGQHWQVHNARVAITPVQKPHPPVWIAAQSRRAARRAAVMGDACLLGPQPGWDAIRFLSHVYWQALEREGRTASGLLGAHRSIAIARDRETAIREAEAAAAGKARMYGGWDMQEATTVNLGLSGRRELADWAIVGSPQDCAETINRCYHEQGLRYLGFGFLNLPREHAARLEYLQFISEELLPLLP
jgi:alkanesulfonate monooxygenase SsuD/methylene tetrahydromethanopterin reductase-like flavin-dependent oxidoreductase (luciferase family)